MATKKILIFSDDYANKLLSYLTGFSTELPGGGQVWLALGSLSGTAFTEIEANEANNYARVLVKQSGEGYPDLLTVNGRTMKNHEQIVFNKVLSAGYSATAIALCWSSGGDPYAFGELNAPLDAAVGSLPMFERNALELTIPDGTEES